LRPVTLVLLVNGTPASADVIGAVQELVVETTLDGAGSFRLRLGTRQTPAGDWPMLDADLFPPGAAVRIGVSLGTNPLPVFLHVGYVATQSVLYGDTTGSSSVEVGGVDKTALMNLQEQTVAWQDQPDSLIATRIFASYQLTPQVDATGPVLVDPEGTTIQCGTDIRFVRRLARRNGFEVYTLPEPHTGLEIGYFKALSLSGSPVATLAARAGDATNVTELNVAQDMFRPTGVVAAAVDMRHTEQSASVTSVSGTVGSTSLLSRLPVSPVTRLGGTGLTAGSDLQKAAQAMVDRASFALTAEGTVDGSVGPLRPADLIRLAGIGAAHSGSWIVRKVVHRFTPDGYAQRFTAMRNGIGADSPLGAAAGGLASQVGG
jgi:phage protein D